MIAALLLAAGQARRFGGDKLRAPLSNGVPVAIAALRSLQGAADEVIAVVHEGAAITPLLTNEGIHTVVAPDAALGMGHSIAAGVRSLGANARYHGCLIALADMPFIQRDTLAQLVAMLRLGAPIVAPEYRGTRGHPVGFSRHWFSALSRLEGDHGARDLLAIHRDAIQRVAVDDPGVLFDVDRPSDLQRHALF